MTTIGGERGLPSTLREPDSRDRPPAAGSHRRHGGDVDTGTPIWFQYLVLLSCSGVLSFGGFGLLLAVIGHFSAVPAFLLGAAGTAIFTVLARPAPIGVAHRAPARCTIPAIGTCLVAISVAAWNAVEMGHNVAVASDPGVYLVAGRWLASHRSLLVPAASPWAGKGSSFNTNSVGMYPGPHGTLEFQFAHLLPVLQAEAHQLGGDQLMFRVPAVLGAVALCAIYAVGCRLVRRPWLMLAAVTALAISLPQLNVSRDTFSETATQVLLWGGIWLLLRAYEERRPGVALVAGLALGGTLMTRIDAPAYLIPLPLLAAVAWLATSSPADRRSLARLFGALAVGVVPPALLGTIDVQRRAGQYYDALHHEMRQLYLLLAVCLVVALGVMVFRPRLAHPVRWFVGQRRQISVVAAWVVGVGLLLAWAVRPLVRPTALTGPVGLAIANVQRSENLPVRTETYAEHTMQWLAWYVGPVTMVLAIAGLCLMTVLAIRRGVPPALVVLAMAAPLTAIYLWNPNITPIQIWASRRYVPASLPLILLAAAVAIDGAVSALGQLRMNRAWPPMVAVVGALGMVVFPLATVWPVRSFNAQANYLPLVNRTCQVIGPDAAIVFPSGDYDGLVLAQTFRSWCDVPVTALAGSVPGTQLASVAAAFQAEGKNLWVLASTPGAISQISPALTPVLIGDAKSPRELEQTVDRAPERYASSALSVFGAKVP